MTDMTASLQERKSKSRYLVLHLLCWTVLIVLLSVGFEKLFSALLHRGFERMEAR